MKVQKWYYNIDGKKEIHSAVVTRVATATSPSLDAVTLGGLVGAEVVVVIAVVVMVVVVEAGFSSGPSPPVTLPSMVVTGRGKEEVGGREESARRGVEELGRRGGYEVE